MARACASSSLIPAVNKLGTVPLMIAASEDVKARYLAPVARGEAMFSYALSEPEAGSDAAAMKTRAVRTDSGYVLNGVKRWITNAGVAKYYTVMAVTDPSAGANGISAFVLEDGDPGFTFGAPEHKLGIKGSPTRSWLRGSDSCQAHGTWETGWAAGLGSAGAICAVRPAAWNGRQQPDYGAIAIKPTASGFVPAD